MDWAVVVVELEHGRAVGIMEADTLADYEDADRIALAWAPDSASASAQAEGIAAAKGYPVYDGSTYAEPITEDRTTDAPGAALREIHHPTGTCTDCAFDLTNARIGWEIAGKRYCNVCIEAHYRFGEPA